MENADRVRQLAEKLVDLPDAEEPFDRIREAIKEAHSQIARAQSAQQTSTENARELPRAA